MKWIRKIGWLWILVLFIIALPFIIGAIYKLEYPQIIPIEMGDLLSYYATAFAIPGSFAVLYVTRKTEIEDHYKNKINEQTPHFTVSLKKKGNFFDLEIYGCGKGQYRDIFFYETRICDIWTKDYNKYSLLFDEINDEKRIKGKGITRISYTNSEFENGYPKEFSIICENVKLGMIFVCNYKMHNDCGIIKYDQDSFDIV